MQRGLLMLLLGGVFVLLGLFTMPMKRANPKQNLVDNPFGWGLFGFGLSSLLVGIATSAKEKKEDHDQHSIEIKDVHFEDQAPERAKNQEQQTTH
ncbi:MAG TPA: hypothetical protein VJ824_04235 [Bacillota bacterium]|nr:hypothetical protein [Bacillota bacterium]